MSFIFDEFEKKFGQDENSVRQLNPLVLASVGDAYYSLCIRSFLAAHHDYNASALHREASKLVCARAQKEAFFLIEDSLSENEEYIAKRGRNSHPATVPKNADVNDYRIATAFEALLGYLYICKKEERLNEIIKKVLENK